VFKGTKQVHGLLLQLLVLVILLLTKPYQSAPSTMVISTVCVWSELNLWETCVWCAMCELCVWWVWELTIHFFSSTLSSWSNQRTRVKGQPHFVLYNTSVPM